MTVTNDVRLWLYPGASPNTAPSTWEPYFTDISAYIRRPGNDGGRPIQYSAGKQDESTQTDAGQMTLTLDNRDGRFSTDKIDGPYYGSIDTGNPIRLAVTVYTDNFNRTVAAGGWGGNWTPDGFASTFSVDGTKSQMIVASANTFNDILLTGGDTRDVQMESTFYPSAAATGASYGAGHMARFTDDNNFVFTTLEFNVAGDVTVKVRNRAAGVETTVAQVNPIPSSTYTAGAGWRLKTQFDGDAIRVKAWAVSGSEPSTWTAVVTTTAAGAGTGLGIYVARFNGNTNSGVANLMGMDDFAAYALEWAGTVVSWPLSWDMTGNNSWAPITAAGILRRLRQGTNPIQSPLRRQLSGTANVTGYWPLEDGADALYGSPLVPGTVNATVNGVTFAQDSTLPGGGPAPTITSTTGSIMANVAKSQGGTGFSAMMLFKIQSLPSVKTRIARVRCSRGPSTIYDFSIDASNTYLEAIAGDGSVIASVTNGYGTPFAGKWIAWQLETDNTAGGGNTSVTGIYHAVGETNYYAQSFNIAGTALSNVLSMSLEGVQGTSFAHMWLGQNTLPFVSNTFSLVSSGYAGETAIARFSRVCGEAGIVSTVFGGSSQNSEAMGAQKESTTMAVLQSCADADYGVISERSAGLEFIPRAARWNLATTVTISKAAGQIARVPTPVRDDQKLRNKWTISRTGGGTGIFQNDASVAKNGTWEDSAAINSQDDSVLVNHAAWRVYYGTSTRLRWPNVGLNFARSPSLVQAWRQRRYGWRLGITSGLLQVTGNEPDLIVEGYQASIDPDIWTVDLNCTDARVWAAAVTDDTGIYGRADNEYCTTTASISATDLAIPITTGQVQGVNMPKWDNTAGLWSGGVDFNIGGERVTVTSITNGAGQAQTLNVTVRGVNGYAFTHASGTAVSLWNPAIVAL